MIGVFPYVTKTAKIASVFKKDSKLDNRNYRSISLLQDMEKIFEKRTYKRLYIFFIDNIISNLQFGFRQ